MKVMAFAGGGAGTAASGVGRAVWASDPSRLRGPPGAESGKGDPPPPLQSHKRAWRAV